MSSSTSGQMCVRCILCKLSSCFLLKMKDSHVGEIRSESCTLMHALNSTGGFFPASECAVLFTEIKGRGSSPLSLHHATMLLPSPRSHLLCRPSLTCRTLFVITGEVSGTSLHAIQSDRVRPNFILPLQPCVSTIQTVRLSPLTLSTPTATLRLTSTVPLDSLKAHIDRRMAQEARSSHQCVTPKSTIVQQHQDHPNGWRSCIGGSQAAADRRQLLCRHQL